MNESFFPILPSADGTAGAVSGTARLSDVALVLRDGDDVAVALSDLARGLELTGAGPAIRLRENIPMGHKFALRPVSAGSQIVKYAHPIGLALSDIHTGDWVHIHNVELAHDVHGAVHAVERPRPPFFSEGLPRSFAGYLRADGRVGTRNYIAVVATSNCSSHVCMGIADEFRAFRSDRVDGVVAIPHHDGCGHHDGPDIVQLNRTLTGIALHANVAAVLLVGLGCEINHIGRFENPALREKRFETLEIQKTGGTLKTIAAGARVVSGLIEEGSCCERTDQPVAGLLLGLNCGGSDAFSGVSANPALGHASDLLVSAGGTAVLAETPEIYGAEHLLTRRAVDVATGERLLFVIRRYQEYAARFGASLDSNPAPGNYRGGITNIVEKSLGAVMKGGTTMLSAVVDYAEQVSAKGLVVMDTPGYDPVSITGIAAGGCNLIAFTTGRGSAIGFPIVPVLKIATNSRMYATMSDNMDVNAGEIVDGVSSVTEKGVEIFRRLVGVASGERTKSELLGHREFVPWRIGPVM
jgi:altronate hydrolase